MESFKETNTTSPKTRGDEVSAEARSSPRGEDGKPCRRCWGAVVNMKNDHFSARLWGHCRQESGLTANLNRNVDNERGNRRCPRISTGPIPGQDDRKEHTWRVGGVKGGRERERTFFFS